MDGQSYNVTSQGQGTFNSVGAGAGIAALLSNFFGMNCRNTQAPVEVITSQDKPVSRYEAAMMDSLAKKDAEIAQLKADKHTDEKFVEALTYVNNKFDSLAQEVRGNKKEQDAVNLQQAVYNGANTATLQCMKGQIDQLLSLTKLVIPNASVCPGWGEVTVKPATSTTTTPAA